MPRRSKSGNDWVWHLPNDVIGHIVELLLTGDTVDGLLGCTCLRLVQKSYAAIISQWYPSSTEMMRRAFYAGYRWTVRPFDALQGDVKVLSNAFQTPAGHVFRLLLFPRGNGTDTHNSLYLEVVNPELLPENWRRYASIRFEAQNADEDQSIVRWTQCEFNTSLVDWGFRQLVSLQELHNGFLDDGGAICIRIQVDVMPPREPLSTVFLTRRWRAQLSAEHRKAVALVLPRAARDLRRIMTRKGSMGACPDCGQRLTMFYSAARNKTRASFDHITCAGGTCSPVHVLSVHSSQRLARGHDVLDFEEAWPSAPSEPLAPEFFLPESCASFAQHLAAVLSPTAEGMREQCSRHLAA